MESHDDKWVQPGTKEPVPAWLFAVGIIVVQILIAAISYPFMPALVPSHWSAAGQINGYMPRLQSAILFPALSLGEYVLIRVLVAVGPNMRNTDKQGLKRLTGRILIGLLLFELALQILLTLVALGYAIDVTRVISVFVSVLMVFLGNYLGKVQSNYWVGIRTPWTLSSEIVWERTHRLGGWSLVLTGIVGLGISFVPGVNITWVTGLVIVWAAIVVLYSYVVYQRVESHEG